MSFALGFYFFPAYKSQTICLPHEKYVCTVYHIRLDVANGSMKVTRVERQKSLVERQKTFYCYGQKDKTRSRSLIDAHAQIVLSFCKYMLIFAHKMLAAIDTPCYGLLKKSITPQYRHAGYRNVFLHGWSIALPANAPSAPPPPRCGVDCRWPLPGVQIMFCYASCVQSTDQVLRAGCQLTFWSLIGYLAQRQHRTAGSDHDTGAVHRLVWARMSRKDLCSHRVPQQRISVIYIRYSSGFQCEKSSWSMSSWIPWKNERPNPWCMIIIWR